MTVAQDIGGVPTAMLTTSGETGGDAGIVREWRSETTRKMFYAAFVMYCLGAWIRGTAFGDFFGIDYLQVVRVLTAASALVMMVVMVRQIRRPRELLVLVALAVPFLLVTAASGTRLLLWDYLFVVAAMRLDRSRVARTLFVVVFLVVGICAAASMIGLIPNYTMPGHGSDGLRQSMGMAHPNTFGFALFVLSLLLLEMRGRDVSLGDIAFIGVLTVFSNLIADSRTWSGAISVLLVFAVFVYWRKRRVPRLLTRRGMSVRARNRLVGLLCLAAIAFCALASLYFMFNYNPANPLHARLNSLSSDRLALMHYYTGTQGVPLLGQHLAADNTVVQYNARGDVVTFLCDNFYANTLINYGILGFACLMVPVCLYLLKWDAQDPEMWLHGALGLTLFFVAGLFETYAANIQFDFYLLWLGMLAAPRVRECAPAIRFAWEAA